MIKNGKLLIIACLFLALPVTIAVVAWTPEEPSALYSRLDRPIYVQIAYGNLIGEPVFVPHKSQIIPAPEFYIIMGGLSQYDVKVAQLRVYTYNRTTHDYTDQQLEVQENITLAINNSISEFFAIEKIILTLNNTQTYLCVFEYRDIHAKFYYEPDPIYIAFQTNQFLLYGWGVFMVLATAVDLTIAAVVGKKVQRRTITVPKMPVFEILSMTVALLSFTASFIIFQFPYTGVDLVIHVLMGNSFYLCFPFLFVIFTLWFAHRHSDEFLRVLQIDLSRFRKIEGENKAEWTKDLQIYYCYYYRGRLCLLKDPDDWKGFFGRMIGWHIEVGNYQRSMQPDRGYWIGNDKRVFISCNDVDDFDGHFEFNTNLTPSAIVTFALAVILLFAGMANFLGGWADYGLMGLGILLFGLTYFFRHSIFYISYKKGYWHMEPNMYREKEAILYSETDFQFLQDRIIELEAQYNDAVANQQLEVALRVKKHLDAIESVLDFRDLVYEKGRMPTEKEMEEKKLKKEKSKEQGS
jgi:hypothetical protein